MGNYLRKPSYNKGFQALTRQSCSYNPTCFREYAKETGFGMEIELYLCKKIFVIKNEEYYLN